MTTEDVDGVECELYFSQVIEDTVLKAKVGDTIVIGYLMYDDDRDLDNHMGDGMGTLYSFHRHASDDHSPGLEALGRTGDGDMNLDAVWDKHYLEAGQRYAKHVAARLTLDEIVDETDGEWTEDELDTPEKLHKFLVADADMSRWNNVLFEVDMESVLEYMWEDPQFFPGNKDAVSLDCYEHGSQHWSLSGQGMQCRWDTARGAGVWVPDKCLVDQLDSDEAEGKDRSSQARVYAKQFLDTYNSILNGDVYGWVIDTFDETGEFITNDAVWGHIGSSYAAECLKAEFDAACERTQKSYDEAVRTQCGTQLEMLT